MTLQARALTITGQVQGVGFRPFIYRLARQHELTGWVRNNVGSVEVFAQGRLDCLDAFARDIIHKAPAFARPQLTHITPAVPAEYTDFSIHESNSNAQADIHLPVDQYTCDDCLAELNNPLDRRYRYPFINCTQCGPRYTLIKSMPYDRCNTSMADFKLCAPCQHEYSSIDDRRFHAEPVACADCGPELEFVSENKITRGNEQCLAECVLALRNGKIIAIKGIGGYHLMCHAQNDIAVAHLRQLKPRPDKPLAVMFPAPYGKPLQYVDNYVELSELESDLLVSAIRPIVLAKKRSDAPLSSLIAPGLNEIGVMLPYSPLHHLLLNDFAAPLVATSANISGEPVLTDKSDVESRLAHVTTYYLHHNRPIVRPADDSVFRTLNHRPRPFRLGRGYAPLELSLPFSLDEPLLATGGQMKNTFALAWEDRIVISPHIGDMDSMRSLEVFESLVHDVCNLYGVQPRRLVCDAHPAYTSSKWARNSDLPVHTVLHHHAHASSVFNTSLQPDHDILAITWDGVGYGADGSLWGGESFVGGPGRWKHFSSMLPFRLPGSDKVGREPWRSAAALVWQCGAHWSPEVSNVELLKHAWKNHVNAPVTTAVGRLFDAAAALTGVCTNASYEGQAPMLLEAICDAQVNESIDLPFKDDNGLLRTDWSPLLPMLLNDSLSSRKRSAIFHNSMADVIVQIAVQACAEHGIESVALAGGVFQNRVLTDLAIKQLEEYGLSVHLPEKVPLNDGGLCYGQIIEAGYSMANHKS
jgi:hydrogenase maturation protein HypF